MNVVGCIKVNGKAGGEYDKCYPSVVQQINKVPGTMNLSELWTLSPYHFFFKQSHSFLAKDVKVMTLAFN